MNSTIPTRSPRPEVHSLNLKPKPAKATLDSVQTMNHDAAADAGDLISTALSRSRIAQKEAAFVMGISEPLLAAQLQGHKHLSWQRLFRLPDRFFLELLFVIAECRGVATVRRAIEERTEVSA